MQTPHNLNPLLDEARRPDQGRICHPDRLPSVVDQEKQHLTFVLRALTLLEKAIAYAHHTRPRPRR